MSDEALKWLASIHYEKFNQKERAILLQAANLAYPKNKKMEEKENV